MERRSGTGTEKGSKMSLKNDRLAVGIVIVKVEPILSRKGLGDNFLKFSGSTDQSQVSNYRHMWYVSLRKSLRKAMGMAKRARKGTPLTACRAAGKQAAKIH
jgi:hypothetical protein